jgi:hypothetical protein
MDEGVPMGRGQDSQELGKNMGRLSEIVIEALKEISAQRRPLASSSLCQALSAREDVFHLISEISCCNGLSLQCPDQTKAELKTMKNEILILKSQKERLFNHVIELQEEKEQLQTFYRRSLSTFLTWIQASANDSLYCALNDFKSLLFKDTDLADLEKSLSNIKEIFVKLGEEDLLPPAISNHSPPGLGKTFQKSEGPQGTGRTRRLVPERTSRDLPGCPSGGHKRSGEKGCERFIRTATENQTQCRSFATFFNKKRHSCLYRVFHQKHFRRAQANRSVHLRNQ